MPKFPRTSTHRTCWYSKRSDEKHDVVPPKTSPTSNNSSSHSSSSTETADEFNESELIAKRGGNTRRFPFSSGSMGARILPPPILPVAPVKGHSVYPIDWLLGTMVRDVYTALSQWILDGISAWLLQRSFLGSVRRQVFRDLRHRIKSGPLSVLVTPPPVEEVEEVPENPQKEESSLELRKPLKTRKQLSNESDELLQISVVHGDNSGKGKVTSFTQEPPMTEENVSGTVRWVIFAIELMALIPIVVIGLSLFYILAVGIYNDVQELLRKMFEERDRDGDSDTALNTSFSSVDF